MIQDRHHSVFNGKKLEEARKIRNMTLEEVASLANVSHQSISKYEKNRATPNIEMLNKLSEILCFELSFFYTAEIKDDVYSNAFIYRSKASVAKKYRDQTESQIGLIDLVVKNIKSRVKMPSFDQSLLKQVNPNVFSPTLDNEIEEIAKNIRKKFGLSDGPISNLTALCEKLGIYIVYLNLNHQGIDACSVLIDDVPYIVLNKDITSAVRLRFNIAHELGHIILHLRYSKKTLAKKEITKIVEYEANRLGISLLLPESGLTKDLSSLGLDYLLILKKHWLVSVQAIVYRAEQLELFTPEYALYLRQQISRKKWRLQEPFDNEIIPEAPKLLAHALKYLAEKMDTSLSQISFQTGVREEELLEIFVYDKTIFSSVKETNLVRVK
ncbi:Zn-dependent peptidase ImmA (M78 family)/transcriptional regulator with XRE-family HTH domain [Fontibacillus solani]|uniref:Zn-dependent peptidase ImmA (M78 family)/transcriptional regulator with XRE-family HTH domain n=1 Tax=Fontibacillus solani TaxID=1572857 RepID=A0A7W3SUV3_9BACL|nr:XRE family transcriptional regulator [Fontibacillus solani]MBA9086549.1 Zn-dependent peptidase ImmA (M78 family)/transcriptional regulator with XRE-family HTH domain [Fontibacillus solani]